ncbi:hypothetical protein Tco_0477455 [Tanacetum coccineum]
MYNLGVIKNQNDTLNPSVLNKAKELAPCLYNIDKMGKDELSNHKIISEEELKCEAEKHLKVKQRKSPLSYHDFVYVETQFEEPPKVPLKRRNVNLEKHLEQTQNLKEHFEQAQLRFDDPKLWNSLPMKYFCYVKQSLAKEMKDDLKYVMSLEDEFDETCLILDIQQEFFKTQFESVLSESHSQVYDNEMFEQNYSLENENWSLKKTITQLEQEFLKLEAQRFDLCAVSSGDGIWYDDKSYHGFVNAAANGIDTLYCQGAEEAVATSRGVRHVYLLRDTTCRTPVLRDPPVLVMARSKH